MVGDGDPLAAERIDAIESVLSGWRDDEDVPGISVVVFDDDGVRYATGLGERNVDAGRPATPDTLYPVASISKPVIATAVLQLVQRGTLALDDEVGEYVDVLDDAPGEPITIRELLAHSSGIPRDYSEFYDALDDGRDPTLREHVAGAAEHRLLDRERYMYTNGGYFVLGEVIEAVDGRPFDRWADAAVLDPLGMERSTFDADALGRDDDAITGYALDDDELTTATYEGGAGPSGGLLSTPRELAGLGRFVLGDGAVDGTRVLDADRLADATSLQSPPLPAVDDVRRGYGFGWEVDEFAGEPLVGHLGGITGAGAYLGVLPESSLGVALAFNRHGPPGVTMGREVLAAALGEDPADLVRMTRIRRAVEAVTGTYRAYRNADTAVVEPGPVGTIQVTVESRGRPVTASPEELGDDRWVFSLPLGNGLRRTAEFRKTGAGTELVLSTGKWTTRFVEMDASD